MNINILASSEILWQLNSITRTTLSNISGSFQYCGDGCKNQKQNQKISNEITSTRQLVITFEWTTNYCGSQVSSLSTQERKTNKGVWWMPRLWKARKDAAWRRYASGRCQATFDPEMSEWGNSICRNAFYLTVTGKKHTQGSETSQYLEEKRPIGISLVAASERECEPKP